MGRGPGLGGAERVARCSPVVLPLSRQTRLARLHRNAVYKEGPGQLILPVDGDDLVGDLVSMIEDLIPVVAGSVGQGGASPTIAGS